MKTPATIFETHLPRRVVIGRAAARMLATLCGVRGWRRVAVCSDPGAVAAGILPRVLEPLHQAGLVADVLIDIPAEPPLAAVDALAAGIADCFADVVVAVGGGSVMDAAKVAAVSARHGRPAADFAALGEPLGWGRTSAAEFADRLDALAGRIGLVAQLRRVCVPDDAIAALARDAVAVRRLMDPNPRPVTEADAVRIYRAVLAPAGA